MPYASKAAAKAYHKIWRDRNKVKLRGYYDRGYGARPFAERRAYRLAQKFGITVAQYDAMFAAQHGACALCDTSFGEKVPHIDHDHTTGRVRGLLCVGCNTGLGILEIRGDSWLARAQAYIIKDRLALVK